MLEISAFSIFFLADKNSKSSLSNISVYNAKTDNISSCDQHMPYRALDHLRRGNQPAMSARMMVETPSDEDDNFIRTSQGSNSLGNIQLKTSIRCRAQAIDLPIIGSSGQCRGAYLAFAGENTDGGFEKKEIGVAGIKLKSEEKKLRNYNQLEKLASKRWN